MYLGTRTAPVLDQSRAESDGEAEEPDRRRGTIVALGLTSFFTDISSEMVTAILPLYLTARIGFGISEFGLFDGVFAAATVALLLVGGVVSDRTERPKAVAVLGYALSTVSRLGLLLVAAPIAFLIGDRVGKGLRSAPRDALIARHAHPDRLASSFALHRSMDTAGALLGPFIAWALLRELPGDYDTVFLVSLMAGLAGLATISLAVPEAKPRSADHALHDTRPSFGQLWRVGAPVKRLSTAGFLLGLGTVSDGLLYLVMFRSWGFDATLFPLLFAGTSLVYLVAAMPFGRLADRIGKVRLLLPAQACLIAIYAILLLGRGAGDAMVLIVLALHGIYYAMTDGIYPALASAVTPEHERGRGIGAVGFGNALGRLVAAGTFGLLWSAAGLDTAVIVFLICLAILVGAARVALAPLQGASL